MLLVRHGDGRPGEGWHAHGTTTKRIVVLVGGRLREVVLVKQRWLEVATGRTRHDRPVWDVAGHRYGMDVVVTVLGCWLLGEVGLHAVAWPWDDTRPARRTVQRWAATLAPVAGSWLQTARERIVDHVAPRPLEELLPAGGIPPPGGRTRSSREDALTYKLRDAVWLHENVARALHISVRRLLGVARWRWPDKTR